MVIFKLNLMNENEIAALLEFLMLNLRIAHLPYLQLQL